MGRQREHGGADRGNAESAAEPGAGVDETPRRPESVLVVVYTRARQCLLLERVLPLGFWQSVTGSLLWGESVVDGAARELHEETGLAPRGLVDANVCRVFEILPAWRRKYAAGVTSNTEHWCYLELPEPQPVRLSADEHRDYGWYPLEDAIAKVGSWSNREALERLRP
jgi:dATP pyrophosphohydrolase